MDLSELPGIGPLLDLLCPPRCVFCGGDVDAGNGGDPVTCVACERLLAGDSPRCPACGEPLVDACRCGGRSDDWDGIAVLGGYAEGLREAVLRAKHPGNEPVAAGLAKLLVRKHEQAIRGWGVDVVVPVPMHWLRRASRGTSAADELARGIAAALGLPCRRLLRRERATRMQNELPVEERRANVIDAFRTRGSVAGVRVLLIDDVTTTGATLAGCRRALKRAGAAAVHAAVVARADRASPGDPV